MEKMEKKKEKSNLKPKIKKKGNSGVNFIRNSQEISVHKRIPTTH